MIHFFTLIDTFIQKKDMGDTLTQSKILTEYKTYNI